MTLWRGVKALAACKGREPNRTHPHRLWSQWTNRSALPVPHSRHGAIRRHWPLESLFPMAGARRTRRQFKKLPQGRTSRRGGGGKSVCWSPLRGSPFMAMARRAGLNHYRSDDRRPINSSVARALCRAADAPSARHRTSACGHARSGSAWALRRPLAGGCSADRRSGEYVCVASPGYGIPTAAAGGRLFSQGLAEEAPVGHQAERHTAPLAEDG